MCGLLAVISKDFTLSLDNIIGHSKFEAALNLQEHRGPDDWGVSYNEWYALGHRRLSIQDVSHGAVQPMVDKTGKVKIVFNGEIYNFQEIKRDLIDKGYLFDTKSDTEVIVYAYIEYGISAVEKFIGMFAFVIIDERGKSPLVYSVRDRLGIKPLFFYEDDDFIYFSSEIKSILALSPKKFEIDLDAISSYFSYRYPIISGSFFSGIENMEPGCYLSYSNTVSVKIKYWDLRSFVLKEEEKVASESDCINEIEKIIKSAVDYRMISDVPFGAYLSGGVDSSLLTSMMSIQGKSNIKTYTIGFEEDGYNELEYAKKVSDIYETQHKEIILDSKDYFSNMERLICYKDAPLSVPNEVPLYLMSKELKSDITVVLSGEGADEIFGGYGRIFRSTDDFIKMRSADVSDRFVSSYEKKYGNQNFSSEIEHFIYQYSYTSYDFKKNVLSKCYDWGFVEQKLNRKFEDLFAEVDFSDYLTKALFCFEKLHLPGLLQRVDTTTMATSVEARVPFVDHRLVEYAFSIPNSLKLKWNSHKDKMKSKDLIGDSISENLDTPKYILKKMAEKYLPDDILYRKKMGFPVPLDRWFIDGIKEVLLSKLENSGNPVIVFFDVGSLINILNNDDVDYNLAMRLWMILNVLVFGEHYSEYIQVPEKRS